MTVSEGLLRRFNVKSVRFVRKVIKLGLIVRAAVNPLSANPTKWSNRLKQFVGNMPTNCLSVFDHFVGLALKGLTALAKIGQSSSLIFCLMLVGNKRNKLAEPDFLMETPMFNIASLEQKIMISFQLGVSCNLWNTHDRAKFSKFFRSSSVTKLFRVLLIVKLTFGVDLLIPYLLEKVLCSIFLIFLGFKVRTLDF